MKKIISILIFCLFFANFVMVRAEEINEVSEFEIFVSQKNGDDSKSGTLNEPLKTINMAKEVARKNKEQKVTIFIMQGDYFENINFDKSDERKAEYPLSLQNYKTDKVRLIGAVNIDASKATNVTDSKILKRLPQEVKNDVLEIDLKKLGIEDYGQMSKITYGEPSLASPELFINEKASKLARWPNGEYAEIATVTDRGIDSLGISEEKNTKGITFTINDERAKKWANAKDVWLFGFWYWDWANDGLKVKEISAESGAIKTVHSASFGARANQRFYIYNLLEELDEPGEFYLDRDTGKLYLYPEDKLSEKDDILLSLNTKPLINFSKTSNIKIKGIEIGYTRERAIVAMDSKFINIEDCKIHFTGQVGVSIEKSYNVTISGCTITQTGAGGVKATGGDFETLTPSNYIFTNNHVYDYSRIVKNYTPAFRVEGVGAVVSHNLIHDAEHNAIMFNGNDHLIEYNEIYNVCYSTDDSGAIYTGQRWNDRGNIIRYNYLHDIKGPSNMGVSGVYLDDIHSSTHVYGNIFYKVTRAILVGGGRDNIIENNLILEANNNSQQSIFIDQRGVDDWFKGMVDKKTGISYQNLSKVPYRSEIWKEKYPKLYDILENNPEEPRGNIVKNNVIYNHKDMSIAPLVKKYGEISNNLMIDDEDIGFVDYENKNFNLKQDSVIFDTIPEFKPIPFDEIGLLGEKIVSNKMSPFLTNTVLKNKNNIIMLLDSNFALVAGVKFEIDVAIKNIDSVAYIPLRFICEKLLYNVTFDQEKNAVNITKNDTNIILFLNSGLLIKNGEEIHTLLQPIVENERTFVTIEQLRKILQENIFTSSNGVIIIAADEYSASPKELSVLKDYLSK